MHSSGMVREEQWTTFGREGATAVSHGRQNPLRVPLKENGHLFNTHKNYILILRDVPLGIFLKERSRKQAIFPLYSCEYYLK